MINTRQIKVKPRYLLVARMLARKKGITVKGIANRLHVDEQPARSLIHRLRLRGIKVEKIGNFRFHVEPKEMVRLEDKPAKALASPQAAKASYILVSRMLLRKNGATVPELAEKLNSSEQVARSLIHRMRLKGAEINNIDLRRFQQAA